MELVGFAEHTRPCSRAKVVRRKMSACKCESSLKFGLRACRVARDLAGQGWPLRTDRPEALQRTDLEAR